MQKKVSLVVFLQCYNNENKIAVVCKQIINILKKLIRNEVILESSYLYLIDENSQDQTWYEIGKMVAKHPNFVKAIKLHTQVKSSALIKNNQYCQDIVVNFNNYNQLESYVKSSNKSVVLDKFAFLKDIFKSSKYNAMDEY